MAALRFFAEGSYQHGVGADNNVGMAQSTVSKSLSIFLDVMQRKLCSQWIKFEQTEEEKSQAKRDFYAKACFPGVTMCVDGTHIKIIKPSEEEFLYYNRKGYFSINAMVVCDNEMRITFIDAKYPGCNHDALIWSLSKARSFLEQNYRDRERNSWLLDLKNIINQQSNDGMDFVATASTATAAAAAATTTTTAAAAPTTTPMTATNVNPLNTLPPPLIPAQQPHQLQSPNALLNPMMVDYNNHSKSMMPPTSTTVPTAVATAVPLGVAAPSSRPLENLMIFDNFDVHETHRIEDGICTQLSRLPPKKQELLKQFGIQTNQTVTYYEKYILIENFNRFCNEYKVADHRPFLDLSESGLPKSEQLKFIRYLGQGLPNLTLNKIYLIFKDILGLSRIEKMALEGYNLDAILKKKKKNLYNRMTAAAVHKECNPDVPSPAIPTAAVVTQPTTAAPIPAPALMPIYQPESYKT